MQSVEAVFERYEDVRHRMPQAKAAPQSNVIGSLLDIADRALLIRGAGGGFQPLGAVF